MPSQYLGQIGIFSFGFAPKDWALCNGQLVSIPQNQALFSLLGTKFGGDGIQTFALPNLQGVVPMHVGPNLSIGMAGGQATHSLTIAEMPAHNHSMSAKAANGTVLQASSSVALGQPVVPGPQGVSVSIYSTAAPTGTLASPAIANNGFGVGHENMQPYTVVSYAIAMSGIYPSRS